MTISGITPASPLIKGIKVGDKELKLPLYADNLVVYLSNHPTSLHMLRMLLNILQEFGEVLGLHINISKSELYPTLIDPVIKSLIQSTSNLKWVSSSWRYLGIETPLIFLTCLLTILLPCPNKFRINCRESFTRLYLTPCKLAKIYKPYPNACWKQCKDQCISTVGGHVLKFLSFQY